MNQDLADKVIHFFDARGNSLLTNDFLAEQNDRLRKENSELKKKLISMQRKMMELQSQPKAGRA